MARTFLSYDLDQRFLLPPDVREWLPEAHLARFILDVVDTLDLAALMGAYTKTETRGRAGYDPKMLLSVLLYAYCVGLPSSRQIERRTHEDVAFRVLSGNRHPDHDTIASFRKENLAALAALFVQVLRLCQEAGLVKLGNVCIDGTKVKANASKHKAMSYGRMCETEARLMAEVKALLESAEATDAEEDAQSGKGKHGDELPAELARRESRLAKIRAAKTALEEQARRAAEEKAAEARAKNEARERKQKETGKKSGGRPAEVPKPEEVKPEPTAQRNFTDPESRIMMDGASKSFEQCYNAQAAVDSTAQVIVAAAVTQQANDKQQLVPMVEQLIAQSEARPAAVCADAGYYGAGALANEVLAGIDVLVPPDRMKRRDAPGEPGSTRAPADPRAEAMREKLRTDAGAELYRQRKAVVEPVFGQIKEVRGFRRFSLRGRANVSAEWNIICLTHNLLKLFKAATRLPVASTAIALA